MLINPELLNDKAEELPFDFETSEEERAFREQLAAWSNVFGKIYVTEINEVVFFFRALTRQEFQDSVEFYPDVHERNEYVCSQCIIEPDDLDYNQEIFAGVPETLCSVILRESGFTDVTKVEIMIARWEQKLLEPENRIPLIIKEAFPDYKLEEIEGWTMDRIAEYYVKAKWSLENLRGVRLVSDEEAAQ